MEQIEFKCDDIEINDNGESFTFLSVTSFSDNIFIHTVPKQYFAKIEDAIEEAIEHECLHLAMQSLWLYDESLDFDNVCPQVGTWNKILNELEHKKT
jgi:hypothetical protein